jgi:hypothetical protein
MIEDSWFWVGFFAGWVTFGVPVFMGLMYFCHTRRSGIVVNQVGARIIRTRFSQVIELTLRAGGSTYIQEISREDLIGVITKLAEALHEYDILKAEEAPPVASIEPELTGSGTVERGPRADESK